MSIIIIANILGGVSRRNFIGGRDALYHSIVHGTTETQWIYYIAFKTSSYLPRLPGDATSYLNLENSTYLFSPTSRRSAGR